QWRNAKDQAALIRGDRALAHSYEQNMLALRELVAQGQLAIEDKKLDQAERLFNEGLQLNPSDPEAKAGIQVIEKLRDGRLKREDLEAQLREAEANAVRIDKEDKAGAKPKARRLDPRLDLVALNQQGQAQPPAEQQQNLLQEQKRLQAVEDQRATA